MGDDAEQPRHRAWRLGERESGTARLEEAVAAYRAALEEWTRERVPLDWAMTQNNLGNALRGWASERAGRRLWMKRWRPTVGPWKFFQLLTLITMKPFATPIEERALALIKDR